MTDCAARSPIILILILINFLNEFKGNHVDSDVEVALFVMNILFRKIEQSIPKCIQGQAEMTIELWQCKMFSFHIYFTVKVAVYGQSLVPAKCTTI